MGWISAWLQAAVCLVILIFTAYHPTVTCQEILPKNTVVVVGMTGGSQELANMLVNERADNVTKPFVTCFNQDVKCDTTPAVRAALSGKYTVMLVPIKVQLDLTLQTVVELLGNFELRAMFLVVLVEARVQAVPLQKLHETLFGSRPPKSSRMVWVHLDVASVDHDDFKTTNPPLKSVFESGPWMSLAVPDSRLFRAASSAAESSEMAVNKQLQSREALLRELNLIIDTIPFLDTDRSISSPQEFVQLKNQVALDKAERSLRPLPDDLTSVFSRCSSAQPDLAQRIQEARIQLRQCWTEGDTSLLSHRELTSVSLIEEFSLHSYGFIISWVPVGMILFFVLIIRRSLREEIGKLGQKIEETERRLSEGLGRLEQKQASQEEVEKRFSMLLSAVERQIQLEGNRQRDEIVKLGQISEETERHLCEGLGRLEQQQAQQLASQEEVEKRFSSMLLSAVEECKRHTQTTTRQPEQTSADTEPNPDPASSTLKDDSRND